MVADDPSVLYIIITISCSPTGKELGPFLHNALGAIFNMGFYTSKLALDEIPTTTCEPSEIAL